MADSATTFVDLNSKRPDVAVCKQNITCVDEFLYLVNCRLMEK